MGRNWAEGTTILAVEDDLLTAKLIRARLEMEGVRVLEARNGLEGLSRLQENPRVDLICTDLMMPTMDGYWFIREVRELPAPHGIIPILVLSVNRGEEDMVRCLAAGADDYLTKPLAPQVFVEKLWRLYARNRA
jgi:CheY-like chemotaxis protein